MSTKFQFYSTGFENSEQPSIIRESPTGGDPHILCTIARIYNHDALYELCRLANAALNAGEGPAPSTLAATQTASPSVSLRGEPAPESESQQGELCTFGPPNERVKTWYLRFDDPEKGSCVFDNRAEAIEFWKRAKDAWTCTLFVTESLNDDKQAEIERLKAELQSINENHARNTADLFSAYCKLSAVEATKSKLVDALEDVLRICPSEQPYSGVGMVPVREYEAARALLNSIRTNEAGHD